MKPRSRSPGEWIRLMKRQALLMLLWRAFYPSGNSKPTGLDRFHLPLITDFWGRILVRRHVAFAPESNQKHKTKHTHENNDLQRTRWSVRLGISRKHI